MNNNRRMRLNAIFKNLEALKANLSIIEEEERRALDNIPENFQCGNQFEETEDNVDSLDNALNSLIEAIDYINNVI